MKICRSRPRRVCHSILIGSVVATGLLGLLLGFGIGPKSAYAVAWQQDSVERFEDSPPFDMIRDCDANVATVPITEPQAENPWENEIAELERQDELNPPPKQGVLFVGSSSIRMWDLKKSFPELDAINRGFGGSQLADSLCFADRIILKHEPCTVVVYAGDNDIARGKSPRQVADDFKHLVAWIHDRLPNTRIVYISIKPSISRWSWIEQMREANRMIRDFSHRTRCVEFIDIEQRMLGADGKPRVELFGEDGLHLSEAGYELWTSLLQPHLGGERRSH